MYLNKLFILKKLQKANAHLGLGPAGSTQRAKWSLLNTQRPKSYIFGFREQQAIINLENTVISLRRACNLIELIIRSKGHLLFVNTNPKYNKIIQQTAKFTNQSFINHKWIGGFLTNWNHMQNVQQQFQAATEFSHPSQRSKKSFLEPFSTIYNSKKSSFFEKNSQIDLKGVKRTSTDPTRKIQNLKHNDQLDLFGNSLLSNVPRYKKMQKSFEGTVKGTSGLSNKPACVIIFHANQNSTAIHEAFLNQIPIISVVDAHIPDELYNIITYPIPANQDSVQFIYLFCNCILKTILISQEKAKL